MQNVTHATATACADQRAAMPVLSQSRFRALVRLLVSFLAILAMVASPNVDGAESRLLSLGLRGDTADRPSIPVGQMSAGGLQVILSSPARDLIPGQVDINQSNDVFVYDRVSETTVLVSRSFQSVTTAANAHSRAAAITPDGEWILFSSAATNLIDGVVDTNSAEDVFLYRRSTGAITLISRSSTSATATGNRSSSAHAISADGEWILYSSNATNLIAGVADANQESDVFLYRRSTGSVILVSRSSTSTAVTASLGSTPNAMSADGEWVVFNSRANNLVAGVNDTNGFFGDDVFLYRRTTGAMTLVSRSSESPAVTSNGFSFGNSISSDGDWVLFSSGGTNLVSGVVDANGGDSDTFMYRRSTATTTLISRSVLSPGRTGSHRSIPRSMSPDGEWVLLFSLATDLVAGVSDPRFVWDVFLFHRSTGAMILLSRSAVTAGQSANGDSEPVAVSSDGEWVIFHSKASDLAAGSIDTNDDDDAFLYQRSTATTTLLSRSLDSATTAGNGRTLPVAMSAGAQWVLLQSKATNLTIGAADYNEGDDVFLRQMPGGLPGLVTRSRASGASTANGGFDRAVMSADGNCVLFGSDANNLVSGVIDVGGFFDVFLYCRDVGMLTLISGSALSSMKSANGSSRPVAISQDGEWIVFDSDATDLLSNAVDTNNSRDVFLFRRSTGAMTLVSRSATTVGASANWFSQAKAITPDGEWVLFDSAATDLIAGQQDANAGTDVFVFRRSTGDVTLASRSAASDSTTGNRPSLSVAISANGGAVLFESGATDLVGGMIDANGVFANDTFLFQRGAVEVRLVSRSATSATTTASGGESIPVSLSADGVWALYRSRATNLIAGVTDANGPDWDVYLFNSVSGLSTLVSRTATAPLVTANRGADATSMSPDAQWILLQSGSTDLVNGVNGFSSGNAFLYRRSTNTIELVSRSAASPTQGGNGFSVPFGVSQDGEWVLFASQATDLVNGVSDSNAASDVFLSQRSTGLTELVSRSGATANTAANGQSVPVAFSSAGDWIVFDSFATNLITGVSDRNGASDVFLARGLGKNLGHVFGDGFEASAEPGNALVADVEVPRWAYDPLLRCLWCVPIVPREPQSMSPEVWSD